MTTTEKWVRSSFGGGVEVLPFPNGSVLLRRHDQPLGKALHFTAGEWEAFLNGIKAGEFADIGASPGA